MSRLPKPAQFVIYLGLACLAAGLFGMLHNQVSYTLGPVYFHEFKFAQFRIGPDAPPRLGAAFVGWQASWWMGLLTGAPLFALALLASERRRYGQLCRKGFLLVIVTTIVIGALGAAIGLVLFREGQVPPQFDQFGVSDPLGFAHAAMLHTASYLGGVIGFVLAVISISRQLLRERKAGSDG